MTPWYTEARWAGIVAPIMERRFLIALVVLAASIWGFVAITDEVREGEQISLDRSILMLFRNPEDPADPIGPPWFESAVRDVTALGGVTITTMVTLATVGFLLLSRKRGAALFVLASIAGAATMSFVIKAAIERPRPELTLHSIDVYSSSFPSGHATGAAATYLTLAALLARFQRRRRVKVYLLTLAVILTIMIGLSRLYLGVHWPSDVLAGWTLGSSWALLCWMVARQLQRRGKIEASKDYPKPA